MGNEEKTEMKVTDKRKFDSEGNPKNRDPDPSESQTGSDNSGDSNVADSSAGETSGGLGDESKVKEQGGADVGDVPPKIDFLSFILGLGTQAFIGMGLIADPVTNEASLNLEAAQQIIDIISMLREKTKNNLEATEITTIENLLYDLRMNFLAASNKDKESKDGE